MSGDLSDFDLDFAYGHEGEQLVRDILTGGLTVEVKRDRRWIETGNLYIETAFYSRSTHNWVESGLMKTKADRWAFVLESLVIIVSTDDLKKAIDKFGRSVSNKIEPNPSKGFLITLNDLIEIQRGA
jgi:hypothetical protein